MTPPKLVSNQTPPPSFVTVSTVKEYTQNVSKATAYLALNPADPARWQLAFRWLDVFTPNHMTWPFMTPLLRDLAALLPYAAVRDATLAVQMAHNLGSRAQKANGVEAAQRMASELWSFNPRNSIHDEAMRLFETCRFPELESGGPDFNGSAIRPVGAQQILNAQQAVRLWLQLGDTENAFVGLEHLNVALFFSMLQNSKFVGSLPFEVPEIHVSSSDGTLFSFKATDFTADNLHAQTLQVLALTMRIDPPRCD
ncbi:Uncharacterised protein [uncultured archaeon]|nr:Uncharacterised protein [uncultured archaeon]